MTEIFLETIINADIQTVFDNARDIGLHQKSTFKTGEKAIAGRASGLIELGETVTWKARHLGIMQTHTSKITQMHIPFSFTDEMLQGTFKSFRHQHFFRGENGKTVMTDLMQFESPFGFIGKMFNRFFLKNYMTRFLLERNKLLKSTAEKLE